MVNGGDRPLQWLGARECSVHSLSVCVCVSEWFPGVGRHTSVCVWGGGAKTVFGSMEASRDKAASKTVFRVQETRPEPQLAFRLVASGGVWRVWGRSSGDAEPAAMGLRVAAGRGGARHMTPV